MPDLSGIPPWLGTAVVGAVGAVLGYFGRSLLRWWTQRQTERAARRARLQELGGLLEEAGSLFRSQNSLAQRLLAMVVARHPGADTHAGYEATFTAVYPQMTAEERELHAVIRGVTETAFLRVNTAMSQWLRADTVYKFPDRRSMSESLSRLRDFLVQLELHLDTWHAKYAVWIPGRPEHALVYMEDEAKHGKGFPRGIERAVAKVLAEGTT